MQPTQGINSTLNELVLAVSLELSGKSWKIALDDGRRDKPAIHTVDNECASMRLEQAVGVIELVRRKWHVEQQTKVVVIYEAGQDGFWISRALNAQGYEAMIVDPASIPVARQARRAKTDRLDALMLVMSLRAWLRGERDRMHVIREPSQEAEAQRQLARERGELQKEIGQHRDRIRKLLRTVGNWEGIDTGFERRLQEGDVRCYDGAPLPPELHARLYRESERLALVQQQLKELEQSLVQQLTPEVRHRIEVLAQLKGVGEVGAMRLVLELFWRNFTNRRQVGSCVGLVPQPYDSGDSRVDQGISKQGNRRVRALLIEMSWFWLRYQPDSAITTWFHRRTQGSGTNKRGKRIAIVAVARRLVIALWQYLEHGVIPEGAAVKAA